MNKSMKISFLIAGLVISWSMSLAINESAQKEMMTGEQIKWQVVSSGGSSGVSTSYKLQTTIGQTATGPGTSTAYKVNQGFWQNFGSTSGCCVKGGDANHDGKLNLLDVSYIINKLYRGGPDFFCVEEADAKADGKINLLDVSYIINGLYRGGPMPTCP
jgi:hypothetical protein